MIVLLAFAASLDLTVTETAGLRRFSYPVTARLRLSDDLTGKERFRLLDGKKPVAAQFRPEGKRVVWLDFDLSPGPYEKKTLRVEYGSDVEGVPEPKGGVSVKEGKGAFEVRAGGLTYAVPAGLDGLLGEVRGEKHRYLKAGSKGLWVEADEGRQPVKGLKGEVVRQGPLAAVLRFTGKDLRVDLTFPRSKSWVEVGVLRLNATRVGADLKLDVASPAMVDFGADAGLYVALKKGQTASLRAGDPGDDPSWAAFVGEKDYARGRGLSRHGGWAHAMDRERCTVVAVDSFGGLRACEIAVEADGGLRLSANRERLSFWLHFVPMPVQAGAVTSPPSMMSPLTVEVKSP